MDKLAKNLTNYCLRRKVITDDKYEIYLYGFKLIIADVINYTIVIILGSLLNRLLESIVFLISLCGLRRFTGGFHAKTFWVCRMSMVITYICVVVMIKFVVGTESELLIVGAINTVSVMCIMFFAPIENPNKKLSVVQRKNNKIKSIVTSIVLSTTSVMLIVNNMKIGVTISISMFATAILMFVAMVIKKGGGQDV